MSHFIISNLVEKLQSNKLMSFLGSVPGKHLISKDEQIEMKFLSQVEQMMAIIFLSSHELTHIANVYIAGQIICLYTPQNWFVGSVNSSKWKNALKLGQKYWITENIHSTISYYSNNSFYLNVLSLLLVYRYY